VHTEWLLNGKGEKYIDKAKNMNIVDHGSPDLWKNIKDDEIKFLRSEGERKDREIASLLDIIKNLTSPNK
jgi:hypothetical protein